MYSCYFSTSERLQKRRRLIGTCFLASCAPWQNRFWVLFWPVYCERMYRSLWERLQPLETSCYWNVSKIIGTPRTIGEVKEPILVKINLLDSLGKRYVHYIRAGFNEDAKLGFSRMAATKHAPVATFSVYRRPQITIDSREWRKASLLKSNPFIRHCKHNYRSAIPDDIREKDVKVPNFPHARV